MRIIFNIISIFIIVAVVSLAFLNTQTVFNFTVWGIKGTSLIYHAGLMQVILMAFIAGIIAGIFWAGSFYFPLNKNLKEYRRKLEKTSVQSDEESSKVEVLEAKIATLEKALQSALEGKENN
jgi:hypothetical protein